MIRVTRTLFVSLLAALSLSGASARSAGPRWIAWRVPVQRTMTDGRCNQESTTLVVAVAMDGDRIDDVRLRNGACPLDFEAQMIERDAESSVAFLLAHVNDGEREVVTAIAIHDTPSVVPSLEKLAGREYANSIREQALFWLGQRGGERGFQFLRAFLAGNEDDRLRSRAVFALSRSSVPEVVPTLIDLARHGDHTTRREAIFWLGQRAGAKAADELKRIATNDDEDDDIRDRAVFAISQLPPDRSVPLLIELVKTHKSPQVRKRAMFWLAQTGDPRAVELMEQILTK